MLRTLDYCTWVLLLGEMAVKSYGPEVCCKFLGVGLRKSTISFVFLHLVWSFFSFQLVPRLSIIYCRKFNALSIQGQLTVRVYLGCAAL